MFLLSLFIDFHQLSSLVKSVAHEVVNGGGIVRSVHNHGIRALPHRFQARYPDKQGNRYYWHGRFLSIYYDANPSTLKQVENVLALNEEVLRQTHLRTRSSLDLVNIQREERNPYIRRVLKEQEAHLEAVHHRNETVEQVIEDMRADDGA